MVLTTDEYVERHLGKKGSWMPIDHPTLLKLLKDHQYQIRETCGGSAANVAKGLSKLGTTVCMIGKIGTDERGEAYIQKMIKLGISPQFSKVNCPTGQAFCFVTPDGQKTLRTFFDSTFATAKTQFDPVRFENIKLIHIDGYEVKEQAVLLEILQKAKKSDIKISFDLGNFEVVERFRPFLLEIIPNYIDILFCNEEEAKTLTRLPAEEAASLMASWCEVVTVTLGNRGCICAHGKKKIHSPACDIIAIDTTGAGDLFASGFLYGYLRGTSLETCAHLGNFIAGYVVQNLGAEIPEETWQEILPSINSYLQAQVQAPPIFHEL